MRRPVRGRRTKRKNIIAPLICVLSHAHTVQLGYMNTFTSRTHHTLTACVVSGLDAGLSLASFLVRT